MMKLHRSALFAGLLAIGVVACGDDVQIVEAPPPPPPPLNVSISPQSQTIAIGEQADFAVIPSGGVAGAAVSWTCQSSNTGVASNPTVTDIGCRVTGEAAGNANVTGVLTKGEDSQPFAASVSVVAEQVGAAEVSIFQVQAGGTGAQLVGPAAGQIDVIVNLQRNDERPDGIELVVIHPDGTEDVVGRQMFAATAPSEDDPDAQAVQQITFPVNTAEYEVEDGIGVPRFLNDPNYTLMVRLLGGPTATNTWELAFSNTDTFDITADPENPGDSAPALDDTGLQWHRGELEATAIPVLYSGRTVTNVSMQVLTVDPGNTIGAQIANTRTASEAPFSVTWPASGANSVSVETPLFVRVSGSVLSDGTSGPNQLGVTTPPAENHPSRRNLDNVAPTLTNFERALQYSVAYPVSRWVGEDHSFTFSAAAATPDFTDAGVGRDREDHEFLAGPDTEDVETVESPTDLDESLTNTQYVLGVTVRDRLGNETTRWWDASGEGLADTAPNRSTVDATPGFRFGVDLTPPTISPAPGSLAQGDVIENAAGVQNGLASTQYVDPQGAANSTPSGFPLNPIHTRIQREAPGVSGAAACAVGNFGNNQCRILGTVAGQTGTTGSFDFTAGPYDNGALTDAYYNVEYRAMDDAGNTSDLLEYRVIRDVVAPVVGGVSFPGTLTPGAQTTFEASVVDNLDLARADGFLAFGGAMASFRQSSQTISAFGPPFEQSATATATVPFVHSFQPGSANAPEAATGFSFRARDHARNVGEGFSAAFPAPASLRDFTVGNAGEAITGGSETAATSAATVCWDTDGDGCPTNPTATNLTFSIQGAGSNVADGPLANPFTRVTFYVGLDEDDSGTVDQDANGNFLRTSIGNGSLSVTENAAGTVRTYTWTLNATGELLGTSAGQSAAGNPVSVRPVGYAGDGAAFSVAAPASVVVNLAVD